MIFEESREAEDWSNDFWKFSFAIMTINNLKYITIICINL